MKDRVRFRDDGDGERSSRELRRVWGDWLDEHAWTHWGTLTTRWPATRDSLFEKWTELTLEVEAQLQCDVAWVVFYEIGGGTRGHLHFVMYVPDGNLAPRAVGKLWSHGKADVQVFNPDRPGVYYISKWVGRLQDNFDLSATFPPQRHPPRAYVPPESPDPWPGFPERLDPLPGW